MTRSRISSEDAGKGWVLNFNLMLTTRARRVPNQCGFADYLVLNAKIADLITKRGVRLIHIREGGDPRPPPSLLGAWQTELSSR